MRTLRSARLRLEPVLADNAHLLWNVLQQPGLRAYQDLPDVDLERFTQMVRARPKKFEAGTQGRYEWLMFADGIPEAIGWVSVRIGERSNETGELGYSVLRHARGRGYATEGVRTLMAEAFDRAGLRRVRAYCVPENEASRVLLERIGFTSDGLLAHGATVRGRTVDVLSYIFERARWVESLTAGDPH